MTRTTARRCAAASVTRPPALAPCFCRPRNPQTADHGIRRPQTTEGHQPCTLSNSHLSCRPLRRPEAAFHARAFGTLRSERAAQQARPASGLASSACLLLVPLAGVWARRWAGFAAASTAAGCGARLHRAAGLCENQATAAGGRVCLVWQRGSPAREARRQGAAAPAVAASPRY